MIKNKVNSFSKVSIVAFVVGIALIGIATYAVFNKPATAQVSEDASVNLSLSGSALDKILAALGFGGNEAALGGASGPDKYNKQNFIDSYTSGGSQFNASSTLYIATSITAAQFCDNSYIHVNGSSVAADVIAASIDITFPATSTLFAQCLNYPGAEKTITFRNNSPTAATSTELLAGVGCDARILEATGADDTIEGLNEARVTIRRTMDAFQDSGSVDCIMLIEETVVD